MSIGGVMRRLPRRQASTATVMDSSRDTAEMRMEASAIREIMSLITRFCKPRGKVIIEAEVTTRETVAEVSLRTPELMRAPKPRERVRNCKLSQTGALPGGLPKNKHLATQC